MGEDVEVNDKSFKECPACGLGLSIQDILEDPTIQPLGLTFESSDLETNLYYFDHVVPGCHTTFMIPAIKFTSIIDEPIPEEIRTGQPGCESRCTNITDWLECKNDCFHAPFRRLLIKMVETKCAAQAAS